MKKQTVLLFIGILLWSIKGHSQVVTFQGTVIDSSTQKGIPYVNIGFPAYSIGTSTNDLGEFIIKIPTERMKDTLLFSSVGFNTFKVIPKEFTKGEKLKRVVLKPNDIKLQELVVKSLDAKKLLNAFLKQRFNNYATEPALMQMFCNEVMKQKDTDRYFAQSEGIIEMYKSSIKNNDDHVRLIKGRKKGLLNEYKNDDKVFVIPQIVNGPTTGVILDIVKNSDFFLLQNEQFKFIHAGYEPVNDRLAYVIQFSPKDTSARVLYPTDHDFYSGKIYIDTATFALVRAEFELSARGVRVMNLTLGNSRSPLKMKNRTFIVNYTEYNNKWYFKSAIVENEFVYSEAHLDLSHKIESFVTEIKTEAVKPFSKKVEILKDESLGDKITHFDDSFWEDYNFIKSATNALDTLKESPNDTSAQSKPTTLTNKEVPTSPNIVKSTNKNVKFFKGNFAKAKQLAAAQKKLVFIDVFTTWCKPCKIMAAEAFNDEEIAELMNTFLINIQVDAESVGRSVASQYNVQAYPTTLIVDSMGTVIQNNRGYAGVNHFLNQIENGISWIPDGNVYLLAKQAYWKNKKDFNHQLMFVRLRKSLGMSTEYVTDALIKDLPLDTLMQPHYRQFFISYAFQLDSKTFNFLFKHRELPMFESKLKQMVALNFNMAINEKNKSLLQRVLKANTFVTNDPSVSDEKNEQLTLEFHEKTSNLKGYHESATDLLSKYYLPQLNNAKSQNNDVVLKDYLNKIQHIGLYYSEHIKEKKYLKNMAELINKACDGHECVELLNAYSQLLYRLDDKEKAKTLISKAATMSGNAKEIVDVLERMNKGIF